MDRDKLPSLDPLLVRIGELLVALAALSNVVGGLISDTEKLLKQAMEKVDGNEIEKQG